MSDVLITPASSKIEFKDASSNIDGTVKLDSDGNLELTSNNGISFGDTSSDIFIGNGTDNVDLKFEADGSITGASGVTLSIGSTVSNVKIASNELQINAASGIITSSFSGNLTGTVETKFTSNPSSTNLYHLCFVDQPSAAEKNAADDAGVGIARTIYQKWGGISYDDYSNTLSASGIEYFKTRNILVTTNNKNNRMHLRQGVGGSNSGGDAGLGENDQSSIALFESNGSGYITVASGVHTNSSAGVLFATSNGNARGAIIYNDQHRIMSFHTLSRATSNARLSLTESGINVAGIATFGHIEFENNVAIGKSTLENITAPPVRDCIAIGDKALLNHTVEGNNITGQIAIGSSAMETFTVVSVGGYSDGLISGNGSGHNIAIGKLALQYNVRSNGNIAIGERALRNFNKDRISSSNSNGVNNIAIGYEALRGPEGTIFFGSYNTAIGWNAGRLAREACNNNTMVGTAAGSVVSTGDNNLLLGYYAGTSSSPATIGTTSNNIVLGDNSITTASIKVDWTVTSDKRDKTDIESFTHGLSWINKLNPVTYRWDMRSNYEDGIPDGSKKESQLNIGLIAQEELEVEKEHGYADTSDNMLISHINPGGSYGMQYSKLVPVLINAVKELSAKNDALEARIKALES